MPLTTTEGGKMQLYAHTPTHTLDVYRFCGYGYGFQNTVTNQITKNKKKKRKKFKNKQKNCYQNA